MVMGTTTYLLPPPIDHFEIDVVPPSRDLERPFEPKMRFLSGFVPELWRFLDSGAYVRPILTPNFSCLKLLYLFFGLRYSLQTLRDDRLGQNSTLIFYGVVPNSATRRRGGVQRSKLRLGQNGSLPELFFQIFLAQIHFWVKAQHIIFFWRYVFSLTHFIAQSVICAVAVFAFSPF